MVIDIDTVMSIEEKAKAYDEAIRKIQEIIIMDNAPVTPKEIGEYLFPNLKESEDEKIRRGIIYNLDNMIAYIEDSECSPKEKKFIINDIKKQKTWLENVKTPFINNTDNSFICDIKNIIDEAPGVLQADKNRLIAWLEKYKFEQSIQNGDNIVTNEDGTHFNVSQLERVSQKATETKETAKEFLKSAKIMDENGELADEYRLEKQDEQKPNDEDTIQRYSFYSYKGEPDFKVGDWIADSNNKITEEDWRIGKINEIKDGKFKFESVYGYTTDFPIGTLNQYHLWTINDARDCDVLKEDSCIFMIEKMSKTGDVMAHCCLFNDGEFSPRTTLNFDVKSTVPATKEECEHLFTKMKEMGYECNITDLMARKTGKEPINKELIIKSVKTEPKFKVGDWITDGYLHNKITDVLEDRYIVDTKFAKRSAILFKFEHYYHLWSLKDAKDGDVLAFDNDNIVIFKDLYNNTSFHSYCHIEDGIFDFSTDGLPDWWEDEGFKPATREQSDILFQKMKKAGYEWDAEKKELKIIDWSKHVKYEPIDPSIIEEKSVWTEEDENMLKSIIATCELAEQDRDSSPARHLFEMQSNWLKSIKERLKGEDEEVITKEEKI